MHDNWFAYNNSKPVFRSDLDFVVVEFPTLDEKISHETSTKTSIKTSTKNQEAILKLINEDPRLSAEKLGLGLGFRMILQISVT